MSEFVLRGNVLLWCLHDIYFLCNSTTGAPVHHTPRSNWLGLLKEPQLEPSKRFLNRQWNQWKIQQSKHRLVNLWMFPECSCWPESNYFNVNKHILDIRKWTGDICFESFGRGVYQEQKPSQPKLEGRFWFTVSGLKLLSFQSWWFWFSVTPLSVASKNVHQLLPVPCLSSALQCLHRLFFLSMPQLSGQHRCLHHLHPDQRGPPPALRLHPVHGCPPMEAAVLGRCPGDNEPLRLLHLQHGRLWDHQRVWIHPVYTEQLPRKWGIGLGRNPSVQCLFSCSSCISCADLCGPLPGCSLPHQIHAAEQETRDLDQEHL